MRDRLLLLLPCHLKAIISIFHASKRENKWCQPLFLFFIIFCFFTLCILLSPCWGTQLHVPLGSIPFNVMCCCSWQLWESHWSSLHLAQKQCHRPHSLWSWHNRSFLTYFCNPAFVFFVKFLRVFFWCCWIFPFYLTSLLDCSFPCSYSKTRHEHRRQQKTLNGLKTNKFI